ncbi:uncharacterized protein A4U43_C04F12430 [Asparagus officinalis]|uniref:Uncharacterized protein n=1 Tax=Asparagus officinalis TaxID=4686 RepID=A0A5P1F0T3_ASPOF|nr:uncharacterized protein A4U43_C04F12430 [Asparagus officinalis]
MSRDRDNNHEPLEASAAAAANNEVARAENLPVDELGDVYLLDSVGHFGFVAKISTELRDLWRWALPLSKALSSGLKDMHIDYNVNLNKALFDQLFALDTEYIISHGQDTLLHKQELIEKVLKQSYESASGRGSFGRCLLMLIPFETSGVS